MAALFVLGFPVLIALFIKCPRNGFPVLPCHESDDRAPWGGEDDAGPPAAHHPPGHDPPGSAGGNAPPLGRRPPGGRRAGEPETVPGSAPLHIVARLARRGVGIPPSG